MFNKQDIERIRKCITIARNAQLTRVGWAEKLAAPHDFEGMQIERRELLAYENLLKSFDEKFSRLLNPPAPTLALPAPEVADKPAPVKRRRRAPANA